MGSEDFDSRFFHAEALDDCVVARFHEGPLNEELNIEELGRSLYQLIDLHGFRRVAVDLSETPYVTSSVLGKLITLHRRLHRVDGRLVLCGLQESVEEVMRRSNLLEYFQVTDSRDSALTRLGSSQ
jgi:anti-anti-sigma factor|tara:strand:+ start:871 stop:1248 length:378 start_codon:yes stop_codon:yes gene_type:complete